MCLLSLIVALCLGHTLSRGIEQKNTFSTNLKVVNPLADCLEQLVSNNNNNNNTKKCEIDLFAPESFQLENQLNNRYLIEIKIGAEKQEFNVCTLQIFSEKLSD